MRSERRANSSREVDGEEAIDQKQNASQREREKERERHRSSSPTVITAIWQTAQPTHGRCHLLEGSANAQCDQVRSAVFASSFWNHLTCQDLLFETDECVNLE